VTPAMSAGHSARQVFDLPECPFQNFLSLEPLAKLQWCDEFSTGMIGKRGVRGVLG